MSDHALLRFPTCEVDLERAVVSRGGEALPLTFKERDLLAYLAERAGRPVPRGELLQAIWGYRPSTRTHTLATNIYTLRQKLEADPASPLFLKTLRGAGYQLELPEQAPQEALWTPPAALDRFLGREAELAATAAALEGGRLVNLLGPAGVGKSRLAAEVARRLEAGFPGGVIAWSLEGVSGREAALGGLLRALRLAPPPEGGLGEAAARALAARGGALLLADSAQGLDGEALGALEALLKEVEALSALVTSRRRLGLEGEQVLTVSPLATPAGAEGGDASPEAALESPAVMLLVDRARALQPTLEPRRAAAALAEVAARVGGLPLALELAAARLRLMSPEELAARLRQAPLASDQLASALESSWALLGPDPRRALACCGLFRGEFELADAEAVVGPGALEALQALVDHSLLSRRQRGAVSLFSLLPPVRAFALERLEGDAAQAGEARARHLSWFARMGGWRWRLKLETGEGAPQALRGLDDLRAAVDFGRASGRLQQAGAAGRALAATMELYLGDSRAAAALAGELAEACGPPVSAALRAEQTVALAQRFEYDDAERSLALAEAAGDSPDVLLARAALLRWRGEPAALEAALDDLEDLDEGPGLEALVHFQRSIAARRAGDRARQLACLQDALEAVEERPAPRLQARALVHLADARFATAAAAEDALAHLDAALQIHEALGDERSGRPALLRLPALLAAALGRREDALADLDRAEALTRALGRTNQSRYISLHRANLMLQFRWNLPEARRRLEQARRHFSRGRGHPLDIALTELALAELEVVEGRPEVAEGLARSGLEISRARGDLTMQGDGWLNLGRAQLALGREAEGLASLDEALDCYRRSQVLPALISVRCSRARLALARGAADAARAELAAIQALLEAHPGAQPAAFDNFKELKEQVKG